MLITSKPLTTDCFKQIDYSSFFCPVTVVALPSQPEMDVLEGAEHRAFVTALTLYLHHDNFLVAGEQLDVSVNGSPSG